MLNGIVIGRVTQYVLDLLVEAAKRLLASTSASAKSLSRPGSPIKATLRATSSSGPASRPGRWMAHYHIAEHAHSGMMFSFDVSPDGG